MVIEFIRKGIGHLIKMHCTKTLKNIFFRLFRLLCADTKQKAGGPVFSIKYLEKPKFVCFLGYDETIWKFSHY